MATTTERQLNIGLLIMRLGLAASLMFYSVPRLLNGAGAWTAVGKDLRFLQAHFSAQVVGLILLLVELLAGLGMLTGYLFRISCGLLVAVYSLYFFNYIHVGYKTLPLYAGTLACFALGLLLTGAGRFAVSVRIEKK
jgi:uncharacterized membrane protein YphA (DoxX/SURF4 family)